MTQDWAAITEILALAGIELECKPSEVDTETLVSAMASVVLQQALQINALMTRVAALETSKTTPNAPIYEDESEVHG